MRAEYMSRDIPLSDASPDFEDRRAQRRDRRVERVVEGVHLCWTARLGCYVKDRLCHAEDVGVARNTNVDDWNLLNE